MESTDNFIWLSTSLAEADPPKSADIIFGAINCHWSKDFMNGGGLMNLIDMVDVFVFRVWSESDLSGS